MRMLMGRSGIWAFLILMVAFATILVSATPIFERLFVGGRRNHDYMPNQRTMVTPDPTLRDTEQTPELPEPETAPPEEVIPKREHGSRLGGPTGEATSPLWNEHALKRPSEDRRAEVLDALVDYFDLGQDLWKVRAAALKALDEQKQRYHGYDLLGDPDGLRDMVHQARTLEPRMRNKKWRAAQEVSWFDVDDHFATVRNDELNLGFHLPYTYPSHDRDLRAAIRPGPAPLLISTIEAQDYMGIKDPARNLFKRRFGHRDWRHHHARWITLVPVAPQGRYVENGRIRRQWMNWQLIQFIRHYHIDFDRIVLDGGPEALLTAQSAPMIYAGFVFRSGALDAQSAELVPNFAHVPVFVPEQNLELAESLRRAGHRRVTVGDEGDDLRAWLAGRRRRTPTTFTWRAHGPQQQFAHWINLERISVAARYRELSVTVDAKANEIRIDARGTTELSLFLNDRIVDLDRRVRVLVNGTLEHDAPVKRSFDTAFSEDPFQLRESMFFGLIFPARLPNVAVRSSLRARAGPEVEKRAEALFAAASTWLDRKRPDRAREVLDRVIALGETSWLDQARALLEALR